MNNTIDVVSKRCYYQAIKNCVYANLFWMIGQVCRNENNF